MFGNIFLFTEKANKHDNRVEKCLGIILWLLVHFNGNNFYISKASCFTI